MRQAVTAVAYPDSVRPSARNPRTPALTRVSPPYTANVHIVYLKPACNAPSGQYSTNSPSVAHAVMTKPNNTILTANFRVAAGSKTYPQPLHFRGVVSVVENHMPRSPSLAMRMLRDLQRGQHKASPRMRDTPICAPMLPYYIDLLCTKTRVSPTW